MTCTGAVVEIGLGHLINQSHFLLRLKSGWRTRRQTFIDETDRLHHCMGCEIDIGIAIW